MGNRSRGSMSDWEFIRAAQIERRECQAAHDCAWAIVLGLDEVRSVMRIQMTAYEVGPAGEQVQLARYETSWPNAQVQTFTACLFQAAVSLTRLIEDSRRDDAMNVTKRQRLAVPR